MTARILWRDVAARLDEGPADKDSNLFFRDPNKHRTGGLPTNRNMIWECFVPKYTTEMSNTAGDNPATPRSQNKTMLDFNLRTRQKSDISSRRAAQCQCLERQVHEHKSMPILRRSSNGGHSIPMHVSPFVQRQDAGNIKSSVCFVSGKSMVELQRPDLISTKYLPRPYFFCTAPSRLSLASNLGCWKLSF
jgi:hypothetical protein